jgi:5-(carboxyamino)imidazole ribonucleotide synthase
MTLAPGSTIGILGGGQLGRMLAMAAARLGLHVHIYCEKPNAPAFEVASRHTVAPFEDLAALRAFAETCDVITYEFENVPLSTADAVADMRPLNPPRRALQVAQDRVDEKRFLASIGVPVAPFAAIDGPADFAAAIAVTGERALLKTRRLGYDGKGQMRINAADELAAAFRHVGGRPAILERLIGFEREVSALVVCGADGRQACYDVPENNHDGGILRRSTVPAAISPALAGEACRIARHVADALAYRGVLAVEFFVTDGNDAPPLIVNEIAPRVHNSGHWTMDACLIDQFENHIRAIAGWPLGSTQRHSDVTMTNILGDMALDWHQLAGEPLSALHLYGKEGIAPGRKLGHLNRLRSTAG